MKKKQQKQIEIVKSIRNLSETCYDLGHDNLII